MPNRAEMPDGTVRQYDAVVRGEIALLSHYSLNQVEQLWSVIGMETLGNLVESGRVITPWIVPIYSELLVRVVCVFSQTVVVGPTAGVCHPLCLGKICFALS